MGPRKGFSPNHHAFSSIFRIPLPSSFGAVRGYISFVRVQTPADSDQYPFVLWRCGSFRELGLGGADIYTFNIRVQCKDIKHKGHALQEPSTAPWLLLLFIDFIMSVQEPVQVVGYQSTCPPRRVFKRDWQGRTHQFMPYVHAVTEIPRASNLLFL